MIKPLEFADLVRLPVMEFYETAFRKATGVPLKLVPPGEPVLRLCFGKTENSLCTLLTSTPTGCKSCLKTQRCIHHAVGKKGVVQQINCFAGLTEVAVPVLIDGRHVATLISGQVFRREPTERDFKMVVAMLGTSPNPNWERKARKAHFETPVVEAERFEAIIQLLGVYAQFVAEHANRQALATVADEPVAVVRAKQFVNEHVGETFTLEEVARHASVSRFYFCKIFRKATGMTFTEYVSRARVEKAKSLLVDPSLRVSEIVFAAGFGSIPRFNSVFKGLVGMPPTEYRGTLHS